MTPSGTLSVASTPLSRMRTVSPAQALGPFAKKSAKAAEKTATPAWRIADLS
jgi:hypothetical protein